MRYIYLAVIGMIFYALNEGAFDVDAMAKVKEIHRGVPVMLAFLFILFESASWREAYRDRNQKENFWSYLKDRK